MTLHLEFILYGFGLGCFVWGVARLIGFCFQFTRVGINDI